MEDLWRVGPTHVDFNLTNGCNLACTHCHSSSGSKLPDELTTTEVYDILDQLHDLGVLRVAIAGGEPFMRRDIYPILEHACRLPGWQVAVITNGLFFRDPDRVSDLARRCPALTVNVSLDGSTPDRFHVLRRQAHRPHADPGPMFRQITDGIRRLVAAGITTAVNVTLSRPTIDDCVPTYRLAVDELGADALVGIKFFPGGYGKTFRDLLELPYDRWRSAFVSLTRAKLAGDLSRLQISVPAAWEFYLPLIQAGIDVHAAEQVWRYRAALREPGYAGRYAIGDTAGIAELAIAGDGSVYPSVLFVGAPGAVAGNVRTESLRAIWESAPLFAALRGLPVEHLSANCGACSFAPVCGGGSRARAYADAGVITAVDYGCPLAAPGPAPALVAGTTDPTRRTAPARAQRHGPYLLGDGPAAVRLYFTSDGCQLRANGRIVTCGRIQAALLRTAVSAAGADGAGEDLAALDGAARAEALAALVDALRGIGAQPTVLASLERLHVATARLEGPR